MKMEVTITRLLGWKTLICDGVILVADITLDFDKWEQVVKRINLFEEMKTGIKKDLLRLINYRDLLIRTDREKWSKVIENLTEEINERQATLLKTQE